MRDHPNPRVGVCPCCDDPKNSTLLQTVYSNDLFAKFGQRGKFNRNALFCETCIKWAKKQPAARKTVTKPPEPTTQYIEPPIRYENPESTTPDLIALDQDISQLSDINTGYQRSLSSPSDLLSLNITPLIGPVPSPVLDDQIANQCANDFMNTMGTEINESFLLGSQVENIIDNEMIIEPDDEQLDDAENIGASKWPPFV